VERDMFNWRGNVIHLEGIYQVQEEGIYFRDALEVASYPDQGWGEGELA
jgi:hypothetical protein